MGGLVAREGSGKMLQRLSGRARVAAASIVGCAAISLPVGAAGSAGAASATGPCSAGGAGVVAPVPAGNAAGGGTINLASGCTYSLTVANNPTDGGNGLPVVISPITVNGDETTIAGNNSHFRIFEVLGAAGGALTLNRISITGGHAQ